MNGAEPEVHEVEARFTDGDGLWHLTCSCAWECWDQPSEDDAYDAWEDHLAFEMRNTVRPGKRGRITMESRDAD